VRDEIAAATNIAAAVIAMAEATATGGALSGSNTELTRRLNAR
jgi:hypothetical protein